MADLNAQTLFAILVAGGVQDPAVNAVALAASPRPTILRLSETYEPIRGRMMDVLEEVVDLARLEAEVEGYTPPMARLQELAAELAAAASGVPAIQEPVRAAELRRVVAALDAVTVIDEDGAQRWASAWAVMVRRLNWERVQDVVEAWTRALGFGRTCIPGGVVHYLGRLVDSPWSLTVIDLREILWCRNRLAQLIGDPIVYGA